MTIEWRPSLPVGLAGLRARIVLAIVAIVVFALALVLASLPRLLDGYFVQQALDDLRTRTSVMQTLIYNRLVQYQTAGVDAPRPILLPTQPLTPSRYVRDALGTAESGFLRDLVEQVALANVTVTIAEDPERPAAVAYRLAVDLPNDFAAPGQRREPFSHAQSVAMPDLFWTRTGAAAPQRLVTVTLSEPFSFRARTLETIVGVMTLAAAVALLMALIVSVLLADRLTNPLRRLTVAAKELAEGRLDVRVPPPAAGSEIAELTHAFNTMAERLEESVEFIRRDRDRSRDFVADVSHELRTPIAALRTFNELLADGAADDDATRHEFLEQSRQQIDRLDWLATNLLELSKLDSGLVLLDLRPDDLRAVVENSIEQAQPSAARKDVELTMELPAEPVRQRHDPQRLGQVLANLIGNSIKFTPAGGMVTVRLAPTATGAELTVTDTGVGIDPAELPYVFERFYRGSRVHESRAAGSGLGLSIVRSIVEMHNGRVAISSTPDSGTQVTVNLPHDMSVSSPSTGRASTSA